MTGDGQSAYGLWQVMAPAPLGNLELPAVEVSALNVDKHLFQRGVPPVAVDGDPAVAEVRVLGQYAFVSSDLLADNVQMRQVINDMLAGKPIVLTRQAVERRKDRAALARLRHARLMLAMFRRPDSALSRMVAHHRPITHEFGKVVSPFCGLCGSEEDYPCNLMHSVADAIDFDID